MAGSYSSTESTGSDVPQVLQARIEGLKLLAHHLDEPIVIFNPQMELVYANPSADRLARDCPLVQNGLKENHSSVYLQQAHCVPCPGKRLFQGIPPSSQSAVSLSPSSAHVNPVCPLPRAVPLQNEEGGTHLAVLMGARGGESFVAVSQALEESVIPFQQRPPLAEAPNKASSCRAISAAELTRIPLGCRAAADVMRTVADMRARKKMPM